MKRVKINVDYVIAVEEDGEEACIVTPVKAYCAPKEKIKLDRDMLGRVYYVVEL